MGKENFFGLSIQNQIKSLTNFITTSSYEAMGWQVSDDRARIVPKSLLLGKYNIPQLPDTKYTITHIPELLLEAYPLQDKLFSLLKNAVEKASDSLFNKKVELIPNASVFNWDFRGWRMKFKDSFGKTQKGSLSMFGEICILKIPYIYIAINMMTKIFLPFPHLL